MPSLSVYTHPAACWFWDAWHMPGVPVGASAGTPPGTIPEVMTSVGRCTLVDVHEGFVVAWAALTLLTLLVLRAVMTFSARERDRRAAVPDMGAWPALGWSVGVGALSVGTTILLYALLALLGAAPAMGALVAATVVAGTGSVVLIGRGGRWIMATVRRLRGCLSLTAAVERRRERADAALARSTALLAEQRRRLEADPFGRAGLAEVDQILGVRAEDRYLGRIPTREAEWNG